MRKGILVAALLAAVSCTREMETLQPLILEAIAEESVKSSLSGTTLLWSEGDQIAAFVGSTRYTSTSTEVVSPTSARFTFSELASDAEVSYAVYPAASAISSEALGAVVEVPSEQTAVDDSFSEGAAVAIAKASDSPMVFRNACGFLAFTLADAANVACVRISANEPMTGQADVHWDSGDLSVNPITSKSLNGARLTGTFQSGKTYYVAVFPRTSYTGLTLRITSKEGHISTYTNPNALTLERKGNLLIADNIALKTVPASGWVEKDPAYVGSSEPVVIVGKVGGEYRLISNAASGDSSPDANTTVTVSGGTLVSTVDDSFKWNLVKTDGKYKLFPAGNSERWLYCTTDTGAGNPVCMKVGGESYINRCFFSWDAVGYLVVNDAHAPRFLGYNGGVWCADTFPASVTYPAAVFSFFVHVP